MADRGRTFAGGIRCEVLAPSQGTSFGVIRHSTRVVPGAEQVPRTGDKYSIYSRGTSWRY